MMEIDMTGTARIKELEAALQEALDFIEEHSDVVDGPDGPEPNSAMSLLCYLQTVLHL
jgi:hypothetical protein